VTQFKQGQEVKIIRCKVNQGRKAKVGSKVKGYDNMVHITLFNEATGDYQAQSIPIAVSQLEAV
jgi:hypothetical protein